MSCAGLCKNGKKYKDSTRTLQCCVPCWGALSDCECLIGWRPNRPPITLDPPPVSLHQSEGCSNDYEQLLVWRSSIKPTVTEQENVMCVRTDCFSKIIGIILRFHISLKNNIYSFSMVPFVFLLILGWPGHVLDGFHESHSFMLFLFHPNVDLWRKQRAWWGGSEHVWSASVHTLHTDSPERLGQWYCPAAGVFGLWYSTNTLSKSVILTTSKTHGSVLNPRKLSNACIRLHHNCNGTS